MKKNKLFIGALALVMSVVTACSSKTQNTITTSQDKDTFTYAISDDPSSTNPIKVSDRWGLTMTNIIYSPLIKVNGDGSKEYALAESTELAKDGLSLKVNLRKDVKWSDGQKFTADDVVFTYQTKAKKENGNFKNRKEILKVKGVGPKAYEQMAGFLVIPEGENILDNTVIHPESYGIAEAILGKINFDLEKYNNELDVARERLKSFDYKKFAKENEFGLETVKDVYEALLKDRRDPRDDFEKPLLKSDILNIDNLEVGMELEGTVRNVVKFGAFIDIGLKNDALLHISEISDKYIDDPSKVLSVGQIIKVKIKDVDKDRGRVGLTRKGQN